MTNEKNKTLKDLTPREVLVFIPLLVMIFWMGVYSKPFVSRMEPAVNQFVEQMAYARQALESGTHDNRLGLGPHGPSAPAPRAEFQYGDRYALVKVASGPMRPGSEASASDPVRSAHKPTAEVK